MKETVLNKQSSEADAIDRFYEFISGYPSLVIYGAGEAGKMVSEFMEEEKIAFSGFCVTGKPENLTLDHHKITCIDELTNSDIDTGIIVAVSRKNAEDMLDLLDNRGLPYFYSTDFLFRLFVKRCRKKVSKVQIQDGYLRRISDIGFERDKMYICCPASIGDTLYTAAFVKAYKRENPAVRQVCLILKKGHRELGAIFPSVDEVLVSDEAADILDSYSLYTQIWRLKNYIYGHFKKSIHFEYDKEYFQLGCRAILPRYRRLILGLSEEAELENAVWGRQDMQPEKHNHDIVIMPYAKTAEMLPVSFWEELVRRLRQEGYSVFTNIGGEKEQPIKGTEPVQESLLDTVLLCGSCKAVVSLRSGLCDLLGFTSAKLVVINTSEELYEEWNLQDVFHREDIYNINCFANKNPEAKIDEIMKMIGFTKIAG